MSEANGYRRPLYGAMAAASAALFAWEDFAALWIWLFGLSCFLCVTMANDFFLRERCGWNRVLALFQCLIVWLLTYLAPGYASVPLAVITQAGFSARYGKRAGGWQAAALYGGLIASSYLSPGRRGAAAYPAVLIALSGATVQLLLFAITDAARAQREQTHRIAQLQSSKKELGDLAEHMRLTGDEAERDATLRERARVSRRIHDTIGHALTAISVQLGAAQLVARDDPDEALKKIGSARDQAREGLKGIRQALSLIDEDGLQFQDRLHGLMRKAEEGLGVKILAQVDIRGELPLGVQDFILSALKEGVTNGVRHGGASAYVLWLVAGPDGVRFYLEDNGGGCDDINAGYGLIAMRRQAEELGGSLEAHSMRGEGFALRIQLPGPGEEQ